MNLLEFLDRRHERKLSRPYRPWDGKIMLGGMFFLGYYGLVYRFTMRDVPTANVDLMRDAMLVLGPPIGAIVSAIWRSDRRDEMQAENTGEGFRAMREQAKATTATAQASTTPQPVEVVNPPSAPIPTTDAPIVPPVPDFKTYPADNPDAET